MQHNIETNPPQMQNIVMSDPLQNNFLQINQIAHEETDKTKNLYAYV